MPFQLNFANAAVLLSPLTTQEAVLSSRIEGTQATMGEVLEFEAEGGTPELHSSFGVRSLIVAWGVSFPTPTPRSGLGTYLVRL